SLDAFGVHGVGGFLGAVLTGVFVSAALVNNANGNQEGVGTLASGRGAQVAVQFAAALAVAAYALVGTFVLVKGIDAVWGFQLDVRAEGEGLDRSEHGEVGFDLGPTPDEVPERPVREPRPATVPPNGQRHFTVVVEGPARAELMQAWSAMCGN